jgi:plastocyanin
MRRHVLTLTAAAAALLLPAAAPAADAVLTGTVGPGFTISLQKPDGSPVTQLDPGSYEIRIDDRAEEHNFHLLGPGVDVATGVAEVGTVTWNVTLREGRYTFVCDPHSTAMNGEFRVGNPPASPPPPPPPPPVKAPAASPGTLAATVGPAFAISLKKGAAAVKRLPAGTYTITVRDLAPAHNFHLTGPGLNKKTTVPFTGTVRWRVTLRRGIYRFVCDPHAGVMKGSFRVT